MSLDRVDVERIAHLARLKIDAEDVAAYARNLSDILEFVEQMNAVDTEDAMPMAHPVDAVQRLRPDEVTERISRDEFQRQAPQVQNGLYLVPRVIE